jgi:hypothetical protein
MNGQRIKRTNINRNEYRIRQTNILKYIGTLEHWNVGMLECWNNKTVGYIIS